MFNTDGYRFGFNGKEYEGTFKSFDYGMRIDRPDLGRFLSVDPLTKKFPYYTPYQFAGNMPIIAIDLDGEEPKIRITDEVTGYTAQGVIGGINRKNLAIPTCKAVLVDIKKPEEILATFNVTRDAWVSRGIKSYPDGETEGFANQAFEPLSSKPITYETPQGAFSYPHGADENLHLVGFALRQNGGKELDAMPFRVQQYTQMDNTTRLDITDMRNPDKSNIAEGVMFHISGQYVRNAKFGPRQARSLGCFGFVPTTQRFDKDVPLSFSPTNLSNTEYSALTAQIAQLGGKPLIEVIPRKRFVAWFELITKSTNPKKIGEIIKGIERIRKK